MFLIDYRGYGRSTGSFPNEQRVYADAEAAWRHLTEQQLIPVSRIVIYGRSIGGAIALHLANQCPEVAVVIVESSFTSMSEMVDYRLPIPVIFVDWLLTQAFDSLTTVRSLQILILLIHGTVDAVIPPSMSQTLYDTASSCKKLVWIETAGHDNVPRVGGDRYTHAIESFIEQSVD